MKREKKHSMYWVWLQPSNYFLIVDAVPPVIGMFSTAAQARSFAEKCVVDVYIESPYGNVIKL